jgi:hypothetical protein
MLQDIALGEWGSWLEAQRPHHTIVTVVALEHRAPQRRDLGALAPQERHRRLFRLGVSELRKLITGDPAQHGQGLAHVALIAAERPDDVCKDGRVVGARYAILRRRRDHEARQPAQIPHVCRRQLVARIPR